MSEVMEMQGQLAFPGEIRKYVLGGSATFTLVSKATGTRLTFKVRSAALDRQKNWSTGNQDRSTYFVSVLNGQDNENDYMYMGLLKLHGDNHYDFVRTRNSAVGEEAKSFKTFKWFWNLLEQGCQVSSGVEFWHEGRCCMCGRKLTVPESIASGIGPECASKEGM